jgi:2-dehydro-3-deoxyphosphogluconate aldolase/(4S)-4-hydroxy-2-oxoglutarate aldolase
MTGPAVRRRDEGTVERIADIGIVPVVTVAGIDEAEPLFEALCAGGLPVIEVTLRTRGADEVVRRLAGNYPDALVGAGTVLTVEDALRVIDYGARFVVSPVTDVKVVHACVERGVAVLPGACTPTEIRGAQEAGAHLVKFFPAEAMGGSAFLSALAGPLPMARLVPTGGINADNLAGYLSLPNVAACGGSWMVPGPALRQRRYDEITALASRAVSTAREARKSD